MSWVEFRAVLADLLARRPVPVREAPDPGHTGQRRAPFHVRLEPWALDVAEHLSRRFGDEVVLTVGRFGYPSGRPVDSWGRPTVEAPRRPPEEARALLLDPTVLTIDLDGDLRIPSGHEVDARLVLVNRTDGPVEVRRLRAVVVDTVSGDAVGEALPGRPPAPPVLLRAGQPIPALVTVGTAGVEPELGYAVPAGSWALRVFLERSGHTLRAPLIPLTIT